jgi:hypothetical protein
LTDLGVQPAQFRLTGSLRRRGLAWKCEHQVLDRLPLPRSDHRLMASGFGSQFRQRQVALDAYAAALTLKSAPQHLRVNFCMKTGISFKRE